MQGMLRSIFVASLSAAMVCTLAGCDDDDDDDSYSPPAERPVKTVESISFNDGHSSNSIYGVLTIPAGGAAGKKYPVVVMSHGFNGSADDFPIYVKTFAKGGVASYCYDFRGSKPTTRSTGLTTRENTVLTEVQDLEAVIDKLRKDDRLDKDKLFVFGGSMGGLVSALMTDKPFNRVKVKGLILLYPALCVESDWTAKGTSDWGGGTSVPDEIDDWPFPGARLGKVFYDVAVNLDTFNHIGSYNGPVLIMHGTNDTIAKMADSQTAIAAYQNGNITSYTRLEQFDGEGHGFSPAGDTRAAAITLGFIKNILQR